MPKPYMIAWADCATEHGKKVRINAMRYLTAEDRPYIAELQRYLVAELFSQMQKSGGPWGWEVGPLNITSEDADHAD